MIPSAFGDNTWYDDHSMNYEHCIWTTVIYYLYYNISILSSMMEARWKECNNKFNSATKSSYSRKRNRVLYKLFGILNVT